MTTEKRMGPVLRGLDKMHTVRRRVLGGIGVTALATSAGVFGGGSKAFAGNWMCCNLANNPPNISYSDCVKNATYIWYCDANAYLHCSCCETYQNRQSAGSCRYG
jgi:hypothetical protein